jgi:hypothetical protein
MWLKVLLVVVACAVLSAVLVVLLWYTHSLGLDALFDIVAAFAIVIALFALAIACYVVFYHRSKGVPVARSDAARTEEII